MGESRALSGFDTCFFKFVSEFQTSYAGSPYFEEAADAISS